MEDRFETFTIQIAKISRYIRKIKALEAKTLNLKGPYVSCLYFLYKHEEGLTAKQLCDICDEDKAAISRGVEYLEDHGYLICDAKTEKRYNSLLQLTMKGKQLGKQVTLIIDQVLDDVSLDVKEEERIIFYKALKQISLNLETIYRKIGENEHDQISD